MMLHTWGHRALFSYSGSVKKGTTIKYGGGVGGVNARPFSVKVTAVQYRSLIVHFKGHRVSTGTSRNPPLSSLGAWLQLHVTPTGIASYVAAILIHEGYAKRTSKTHMIQF